MILKQSNIQTIEIIINTKINLYICILFLLFNFIELNYYYFKGANH